MNPFETRTLEAFLRALSQLNKPLSLALQQEIHKVGYALENHNLEVLQKIPDLVRQDHDLNERYQAAYRNLQKQYQAQERTKSLAIAANGSASLDFESQIAQIFSTDDITTAAQKFVKHLDAQLAKTSKQSDFWERGNFIVTMASGGIFLGVLLAQVPGAIIGGLLAILFAWFSSSPKRRLSR